MKNLQFRKTWAVSASYLLLGGLAALALSSRLALAQTGTGAVTGTVRDVNQAVVPEAVVTITETETNISHKGQTSEVGIYYFGALPRGPYTLNVEKPGFKQWSSKLVLEVGQTQVVDPVLEVGNVRTVVEVAGVAPPINFEGMQVSNVKDFQRIRQLPLNGRAVSQLFNLTPGVEGGSSARVNGLKVGSLEITLDGVSEVDRFGGGMVRVQPGLDTIQEFRIETTGSDARYSRPATVILSTRSGTNHFHGSLFETHRNNSGGLLVRRRENTAGNNPDKLIRNEFGASAGGPVYLPGLYNGRNKSFWFVAYEGSRDRESNVVNDQVPTEAMWNGNLSNDVDADGNFITIYDPLTTDSKGLRQPFKGNIIPPDRISPIAKILHSLTAPPSNNKNPFLANNFVHAYPDITDINNFTAKVDQHISEKDNLSVRWTRSTRHAATEGGVFGDPIDVSAGFGTSRNDAKVNNVAVNYNRTISNSLLNELLVGVERSFKDSGTLADFTDWPKTLGLPNPFGVTGWPTIGAGNFGWDSDNRKDEALTGVVLANNVSWSRGKHNLQFGGKIRKEYNNVRELQQAQGSHDFGGPWTCLFSPADGDCASFTGDGFADILLGLPDFLSNQFNRGYFYFRQTEAGLYSNDTWKISPRLTLTLGLRWDKWTPYSEKFNRLATVDINSVFDKFQVVTPGNHRMEDLPGIPPSVLASWAMRGLTWTTADSIGYPSNLFSAVNHDFGPRLGAAFKINNKMVLRGGYGEYFWTMPLSQILQTSRTNPPLNLRFQNQVSCKNADCTYPKVVRPTPNDFIGQATVDINGIVPLPSSARPVMLWDGRNWKDGHARSWNVTLEREVPYHTVLRLSYIGDHGSDLEQRFAINNREGQFNFVARTGQAPPLPLDRLRRNRNWDIRGLNRTGYSNTHSAQVELERRFNNGLGFQWFYTYTRSLTTSDVGGFTSGNTSVNAIPTVGSGGGGEVPEIIQVFGEPNLSYDQRLRLVYFNSPSIPAHRIRYNGIVDLPFGRGKKFGTNASGALNQLIGGWQIAGIGDWRGGFWQTVSTGLLQTGNPRLSADQRVLMNFSGSQQRLWFRGNFDPTKATDITGGDLLSLVPANQAQRVVRPFGPDCFGRFSGRLAQTLADGKTCRNTPIGDLYNFSPRANIIGPGAWNVDLSIFKNFRIKERTNVRFTADFFNAFNHPVDVDPSSATGLQNLSRQVNGPRTIQFSLRIDF